MKVKFFDLNADKPLKYAVICARYNGKWVFCKHKNRDTYEIPGGHREDSEDIETTAKRELWEETGAKNFDICPRVHLFVHGLRNALFCGNSQFWRTAAT